VRNSALICGVLAILFTLLMVNYSRLYGRLLFVPVLADAAYMNDAFDRLNMFYTSGFWGLVRGNLETTPLHSPFSTGLAMISFALLGPHDWAPYIGNVIIVFALVAFAALLMRGAKLWELLLAKPFAESSLRYRLTIGACLGSALVIQPTNSPLTLALFAVALALALFCDLKSKEHRPSLRTLIAACVPLVEVGVLMAIPYYAVASIHVAHSIQRHMVGPPSTLWQFRGSALAHARYFLDGPGGTFMLGNHLGVLLGLSVLGAILALRCHAVPITPLSSFGLVVLISYLVPTLSWAKNQFTGIVFQVLLLFSSVIAFRLLVARGEARPAKSEREVLVLGRATFVVVVLLGLWLATSPEVLGVHGTEAVESRNQLVRSVDIALKERAGPRTYATFVTTFGTVNSETLRFLALQDGAALTFSDQALSDNLADHARDLETADFAVASEPGSGEVPGWLPSTRVEGPTLALIQSNPDFVQIASFPTPSGRRYYLFERQPKFSRWNALSGMGEVEGPYPQWNLPNVRWGLGPVTLLAVDGAQSGRMRLIMSCVAHVPNQQVTVRLDGMRIAVHALPVAGKVYGFETPLDVSSGPHRIELVYTNWVRDPSNRPLATLFAELRLER
jgi:hypothetical protein